MYSNKILVVLVLVTVVLGDLGASRFKRGCFNDFLCSNRKRDIGAVSEPIEKREADIDRVERLALESRVNESRAKRWCKGNMCVNKRDVGAVNEPIEKRTVVLPSHLGIHPSS
ncbi:unnamed protein product, partial [Mesorhabditis belari]|uniref:Uncharacterized protein n=1 Tax=Mesorhabditis belari TaxID=2138241 RepID=A0AAF3EMY0_9BILA